MSALPTPFIPVQGDAWDDGMGDKFSEHSPAAEFCRRTAWNRSKILPHLLDIIIIIIMYCIWYLVAPFPYE
jgi:hypothetical protein